MFGGKGKKTVPDKQRKSRESFFLHVQTLPFLLEIDCPTDGECSGKT